MYDAYICPDTRDYDAHMYDAFIHDSFIHDACIHVVRFPNPLATGSGLGAQYP